MGGNLILKSGVLDFWIAGSLDSWIAGMMRSMFHQSSNPKIQ
jgi:hypothetical protein